MEIEERFWSKVAWTRDESECWLRQAFILWNGYGRVYISGSQKPVLGYAHRIAYELERDEIPEGLELDHLCRVRHCVNPWHLEPVAHTENVRRGDAGKGKYSRPRKTCKNGHALVETGIPRSDGGRRCEPCYKVYCHNSYLRRKHGRDEEA
jgi:hypothetical protein